MRAWISAKTKLVPFSPEPGPDAPGPCPEPAGPGRPTGISSPWRVPTLAFCKAGLTATFWASPFFSGAFDGARFWIASFPSSPRGPNPPTISTVTPLPPPLPASGRLLSQRAQNPSPRRSSPCSARDTAMGRVRRFTVKTILANRDTGWESRFRVGHHAHRDVEDLADRGFGDRLGRGPDPGDSALL